MGGDQAVLIAGAGCRRLCPADEIEALVRRAGALAGAMPGALAIPWFKRAEPGLAVAAARLGLRLIVVGEAALAAAQPRCPTPSRSAYGAVAEGCALAACGPGSALALARIAGGRATCALAAMPAHFPPPPERLQRTAC